MILESPAHRWPPFVRMLRIGALAYLAAVLAGAVSILLFGMMLFGVVLTGQAGDFATIPLVIFVMAAYSLPGFLMVRLILHLLRAGGLLAFALGGACVGIGMAILLYLANRQGWDYNTTAFMLAFALCGAIAGLVYRLTERALWRESQGILRDTKTSGGA